MARTDSKEGYSQISHVIKSKETPKQVADKFGVSVQELLSYNSAALGGRWDAGNVVRNPQHTEDKIKEAVEKGATAEQLASALDMSVNDVVVKYNVLREDELQDIPIVVPDKAKKILLEDIEVPDRDRVPEELLQEVNVDAKKVPEKLLQDIVVPERAKKILFENIEVPDREQKEVPAPYRLLWIRDLLKLLHLNDNKYLLNCFRK